MSEPTMYRPVPLLRYYLNSQMQLADVETFTPQHRADAEHPAVPGTYGPAYDTRHGRSEETWIFLDRYYPRHLA